MADDNIDYEANPVNSNEDPELPQANNQPNLVESEAPADVNTQTDEELAAQQDAALTEAVRAQSPEPVDEQTRTTETVTVENHDPFVVEGGWRAIFDLNKDNPAPNGIKNENLIYPGQVFNLPGGGTYVVAKGDNLTKIAAGKGNGEYTRFIEEQVPAEDPTPTGPTEADVQDYIAQHPEPDGAAPILAKAKVQATVQARYKQPGNQDWRVRLSLGPGSQYLYNATPAGILAPLRASGGTDGVIFPYTPTITTTYSANYEQYDLIHSNYRGVFYKNSRVGDIQLRGTFTAQDTTEANYLLAVIHFFRSATKMFYGQDAQRGTPPPICLLNGYGGYQFSDHPVVISSFNYTLPNDVDYIRTTNPNNFGLNLANRYNPSGASMPAGGALAGLVRLYNAVAGGLPKGAENNTPAPNTVVGSVTNNTPASYVPTKMEIDVTLIPVQSRSQVSQQFSLKGFANGDLIKGGYW